LLEVVQRKGKVMSKFENVACGSHLLAGLKSMIDSLPAELRSRVVADVRSVLVEWAMLFEKSGL
jgi:hypothetical protein